MPGGEGSASDAGVRALSTKVYGELHALAEHELRDQRPGHTLQPTALVHEAFLRIARLDEVAPLDKKQFYALAGKTMRSVLVDHARKRSARKRRGGERRELHTSIASPDGLSFDVLALNDAMEQLQRIDPELVEMVDLTFFAGMTAAEAAAVLGVSSRTVERGLRTARAFLRGVLGEGSGARDPRT
jgi:RNA polymerase sigma factor (TIGR02999 family)